ncbi:YkyA family protein [Virgibacillus halodenitrificans]|uniref:YkyA family protein n=1 Tax=Virgibacillus halodenitrificans TaxID=1482 RepID=UPI0024C087E7|nr:YkyA family protein [Virgibacillus halodenitrificans]WHX27025.1 YkyA family protein [Virgibacillus halodenitrificans]
MRRVQTIGFILVICLILLASCSGKSTEEKIHGQLEEAVNKEEVFEEQQEPITDLEKKEQELYNQIIDLSMDDFDKIKNLSEKAISVINERSDKIATEKESMESSKEEFKKAEELIGKLEDSKLKKKGQELVEVMNNRYDAYSKLNKAYNTSLKLEKEMYKMLQKEDVEQQELTKKIEKINQSYEKVLNYNKKFNEYTVEYNAIKKDFYELAEMNVNYEDNPAGDDSAEKK